MITAVCLNPCFDKTASVDRVALGDMNRLENVRVDVSGKGVNVAIMLKRLGFPVQCAGILGEETEARFRVMLEAHTVPMRAVTVAGASRTNFKLIERESGRASEFNEAGPFVPDAVWQDFLNLFADCAIGNDYIALSGSLPPNVPTDAYAACVCAAAGVPCAVDTSGQALRAALSARPTLIKPNQRELEALIGHPLRSLWALRDAGREALRLGAENALISLGAQGGLLVTRDETLYAKALDVPVVSSVGAGDAMLAGFVAALARGEPPRDAFRAGMASGAASVMTEGTQLARPSDIERLLKDVVIQEV